MKLDELEHVLRAAAAIASENSMVVVGSQAILLLMKEPPESLLVSREVDVPLGIDGDVERTHCDARRSKIFAIAHPSLGRTA